MRTVCARASVCVCERVGVQQRPGGEVQGLVSSVNSVHCELRVHKGIKKSNRDGGAR